jgi:hypothetical protein
VKPQVKKIEEQDENKLQVKQIEEALMKRLEE